MKSWPPRATYQASYALRTAWSHPFRLGIPLTTVLRGLEGSNNNDLRDHFSSLLPHLPHYSSLASRVQHIPSRHMSSEAALSINIMDLRRPRRYVLPFLPPCRPITLRRPSRLACVPAPSETAPIAVAATYAPLPTPTVPVPRLCTSPAPLALVPFREDLSLWPNPRPPGRCRRLRIWRHQPT